MIWVNLSSEQKQAYATTVFSADFLSCLEAYVLSDSRFSSPHIRHKSFQMSCHIFFIASKGGTGLQSQFVPLSNIVVLNQGRFAPQTCGYVRRHFCRSWGMLLGIQWVEAKNAPKHPTMHMTSPQQRVTGPKPLIVLRLRNFALMKNKKS